MNKTLLLLLFCCLLKVTTLQAQSNTVTAGGVATGATGTVTYSIGQVADIKASGPGGTILQGVQQPYEILVITGQAETGIYLTASVYPNPTGNFVILDIANRTLEQMSYSLFDVSGKLLAEQLISNAQTLIDLTRFASSAYFLKVINNREAIKTFKIILTQ